MGKSIVSACFAAPTSCAILHFLLLLSSGRCCWFINCEQVRPSRHFNSSISFFSRPRIHALPPSNAWTTLSFSSLCSETLFTHRWIDTLSLRRASKQAEHIKQLIAATQSLVKRGRNALIQNNQPRATFARFDKHAKTSRHALFAREGPDSFRWRP